MKICKKCNKTKVLNDFRHWRRVCKTCNLLDFQEYRLRKKEENLQKYQLKTRQNNLQRKHGISLVEYNKILETQNNKCAICLEVPTNGKSNSTGISNLHVDHDHTTGKIRGLLCHNCNTGLGLFKENVEIFNSALEYITAFHTARMI